MITLRLFVFALFLLLPLLIPKAARAGYITLKTEMTLSVLENRIEVRLDATNTGNESAKKIKANLYIFDRIMESDAVEQINTLEKKSFLFEVPRVSEMRGRFAFVGETFFHDANLARYSALCGGTFLLDSKYPAAASSRTSQLRIIEKEKFQIYLTNQSKYPQTFKATLFLPHALTTPQRSKELHIVPDREKLVEFEILNRYGFEGAKYPIFCVVEYRQKDRQDVLLIQSLAQINARKNWFVQTRWYWLWGGVGILAAWTGALLKSRRTRKPEVGDQMSERAGKFI